jgi:diguanylate cyclase (GGDEF)-like protein
VKITFTAGIATYPIHGKTPEEIIKMADDALYQAKGLGRNMVMSAK